MLKCFQNVSGCLLLFRYTEKEEGGILYDNGKRVIGRAENIADDVVEVEEDGHALYKSRISLQV